MSFSSFFDFAKTQHYVASTLRTDQHYCPLSRVQELGPADLPRETEMGDGEAGPSGAAEVPYSSLESTAAAVRLHGGDVSARILLCPK